MKEKTKIKLVELFGASFAILTIIIIVWSIINIFIK